MTKQISSHCGFGNKAFIFSLDAAIAVLVTTIFFIAIIYYTGSTTQSMPVLQMSRTGSDILTMLYYDGTLTSISSSLEDNMKLMLPSNYGMRIEITKLDGTSLAAAGETLPEDKTYISGKRIFARQGNPDVHYAIAQYWVWLK